MNVVCSTVQAALPTVGEAALTGPLATHVDSCIACKGEVIRYRTMYRELEALASTEHMAPVGLTAAVMGSLGPVEVEPLGPRIDPRVPMAAAAVVATAAAGTAVLYRLYRAHAA